MPTPVFPRRLVSTVALAAAAVVVAAVPAAAHVTVSSPDAAPGGFGKLVFRVPNESDSASTTRLVVQLPTDTPFASVSTKPVPGWTVQAEPTRLDQPVEVNGATLTEAVTRITWTARDGGLAPDQFTEFEVSVGTFPEDVDRMAFPAVQTYSDGEVARWVEQVEPGAPEPEHPAPVLELAAADDTHGHHAGTGQAADV
ncbi:MAG: YcnI family protein, partial [Actinomycetota bacterium]|nr:YcnI family protein [Actinomycetota bacterium]